MAFTQSFDVEFDDALLDLEGWKNPRYEGTKLTGVQINTYTAGDITYGKNPVIERKTTALYIGNTLIGGEGEDEQYAFIKGHSYVNINKILIIDPESDEVTIIDSKAEDFFPFQQFVTNDLPTGASFSFRLLDPSVENSLDETYFVKMNKGWLLTSFDSGPYLNDADNPEVTNPLFLAKGNQDTVTAGGAAAGKFWFQTSHDPYSGAGNDRYPNYISASIVRNKFVDQYYSVNRPTTFGGYPTGDFDKGIVSMSTFLLSESIDFLTNQGRHLRGNSNTEMHLTLFQGSYDFAPGFNDERSISTFEVDRNNSTKGVTFRASGVDQYPVGMLFLKGKSYNTIDKQGEDPRFLPTFSSSYDTVIHYRRNSVGGVNTYYNAPIDIYVRGNVAPTGSYSGSFGYQVSFLDKAPTIISNINKEIQLYNGIGERGFVLIPNLLDQRVKDNVEYYLEKAGLIDKTTRNKAPKRGR